MAGNPGRSPDVHPWRLVVVVSSILAVAIAATAAVVAITLLPPTGPGDISQLRVEWTTEKEVYAPGELVQIHLSLINTAARPVTLTLSDSCGFGFLVKDANGTVVGPELEYCAQVIVEIEFAPYERKNFTLYWDQTDFLGNPVPVPGAYTLRFQHRSLVSEAQIVITAA